LGGLNAPKSPRGGGTDLTYKEQRKQLYILSLECTFCPERVSNVFTKVFTNLHTAPLPKSEEQKYA